MKYLISHAPHARSKESVPKLMMAVILALVPAAAAGVYFFGLRALGLIFICVTTAVLSELAMNKLLKKEATITDGSAAVTGLLLALSITPAFPYSLAVLGTIFAIVIGKHLFGGLGYNIFNPALAGRAFLVASFPVQIKTFVIPFVYKGVEAVTSATPLSVMKFQNQTTPYLKLLFGNVAGCLGETSALLLLLGGLFLIWRKIIDWRIPVSYLGTVALLSSALGNDPVFHLLAGGLMLGAFFMATDLVTSPITGKGMWIFGAGAGILVVVIRLYSGLPEGVMFSILIMNALTPLINRYTRPRILGRKK